MKQDRLTAVIQSDIEVPQWVWLQRGVERVASAWGIPKVMVEEEWFVVVVHDEGVMGAVYYPDTVLFCESLKAMYRILGAEHNNEEGGESLSIQSVELLIKAQEDWERVSGMTIEQLACELHTSPSIVAAIITLAWNSGQRHAVDMFTRLSEGTLGQFLNKQEGG